MFTNIPQKKSLITGEITFEGFNKNKLIITLGDKGITFFINKTSSKKVDGVSKRSPLRTTSPNAFLTFH